MNTPRITVIIPTRERCDVLEKCLQTVTAQDYDNLEIIVSDNYSNDGTKDIIHGAHDSRVKYINTGKRLSMSHNWEFALSHVDEGWVTIIGDDDGLIPGCLKKVAEIITSTGIRAVRSTVCGYTWPCVIGKKFGRLGIPLGSGHEVRDSKVWLSKVMNGRASFIELPMLYNGGFISMAVLNMIKNQTGAFYKSAIPDIYSALAVASVVEKYIYSSEPLAISGCSRHSIGSSLFSGVNKTSLYPLHEFFSEGNIPFHKDFPLCSDGSYPVSGQALVYESYLQLGSLQRGMREISHAQQLAIILAASGLHERKIKEWGAIFARTNGLDYIEIQSQVARKKIILTLVTFARRIFNEFFNIYHVGSLDLPIRDVYEASVTTAAIRNIMPSRLRTVPRLLGRAVEKISGVIGIL